MTHTTPGAIEIHRRLADLRDAGFDAVAMEVSSHALDQRRIEALAIDTAVFTNLSRDHLDYHAGMDRYARAKAKLFEVAGLASAVVNGDDRFGLDLIGRMPAGIETVALTLDPSRSPAGGKNVVRGRVASQEPGLSLQISSPWGSGTVETRLLGRFNGYNLLAAIAVACLQGHRLDDALERLDGVGPIAGRMQRMGGGARPLVVVDYSHTPDALANALAALRPLCAGALWCVFGCGGRARSRQAPADGEGRRRGSGPDRRHRRQSARRRRRRDRRRRPRRIRRRRRRRARRARPRTGDPTTPSPAREPAMSC